MRVLALVVICLGGAFLGQVVFGSIPVACWMTGALTGILSMGVILS